ncbi:MAG: fluoride efflux transporter CrcB [Bacillota bacterium]
MQAIIVVGLGGFLGSILRYGLGRISVAGDFPLMTMLINILGSFIIGVVAELAKDKTAVSPNTVLFLQTGLLGGFTTFSAFSLETMVLFQENKYLAGSTYAILTVILCFTGTILGMLAGKTIKSKLIS